MPKVKKESREWFSTRSILWFLVFSGFAVNYMVRVNLNISIVSMVRQKHKNTGDLVKKNTISDLVVSTIIYSNLTGNESLETLPKPLQITNPKSDDPENIEKGNNPEPTQEYARTFVWNEYHQGLILSAFYWFHWLTQIPGGILSKKYGTKLVFGLANFIGVLCCFVIPIAAYWGHEYLIFIRAFQGLVLGFTWPAMHNMAAKWIPPNERSRFVTAYLGSSVGAALTYPMCGWIIERWNWELVFYVNGVVGTLWYILWCIIVFDSPSEHPRIRKKEKDFILSSLGKTVTEKEPPVPWKRLLTSRPLWMNIIAQWGGLWGLFTLMTNGPTYISFIHGVSVQATGLLSGVPHVFRTMFALGFSHLGDYLLGSNKMSRTNVRKLATFMCCIVQGIFMLCLAYSGSNYIAAIVFLTAATAVNGAVSTGPLASVVDILPNYAGIALGICNTLVAMVGYVTPLVVSYFTYENQTIGQWQKVFWIASTMLIVTGILYILFSSSELESWNSPGADEDEDELQSLKQKEQKEDNNIVVNEASHRVTNECTKVSEKV